MKRKRRFITKKRTVISTQYLDLLNNDDDDDDVQMEDESNIVRLCNEGRYDDLKYILDKFPDREINVTDSKTGMNGLMFACRSKRIDIVRLLISRGIKLNSKDSDGRTELYYAFDDLNILKTLMRYGSSRFIQANDGTFPFSAKIANEKVGYFMRNRPMSIFECAISGDTELLEKYLTEDGYIADHMDNCGRTLVQLITEFSDHKKNDVSVVKTTQLLFKYGAKPIVY